MNDVFRELYEGFTKADKFEVSCSGCDQCEIRDNETDQYACIGFFGCARNARKVTRTGYKIGCDY